MKTLKEANLEDFKIQYQQIVNKIEDAKKQIGLLSQKIELLDKERHYFLGIIEYMTSKEEPIKVLEVKPEVKVVEPEKKSDVIV